MTPDPEGYEVEVRWVGAFGLSLRVDSLVAASEWAVDPP